jgi:hypothetical protein
MRIFMHRYTDRDVIGVEEIVDVLQYFSHLFCTPKVLFDDMLMHVHAYGDRTHRVEDASDLHASSVAS